MSEWKQANKIVQWREPEPNTHEWKCVGRTPQGGLSGGDDIYECHLCGLTTCEPSIEKYCSKVGVKGKTECVIVGHTEYWTDIYKEAVVGKHIIIKDENGIQIIALETFAKNFSMVNQKGEKGI